MRQYISKSDIIAEIDRRLYEYEKKYKELVHYEIWVDAKKMELKIEELKSFRSFIDTFEVKNVDLDKEFDSFLNDII